MANLSEYDSIEDRMLPSQGIRKNNDFDVSRATPSITDMPGDYLESKIAQCNGRVLEERNRQYGCLMASEDGN